MGKISVFLILILLYSCGENKTSSNQTLVNESISKSENFNWLLGEWKRTGEDAGKETFEIWGKSSTTEYAGLGFTIQNEDTVFFENIRLIKSDRIWSFEVKGKGQLDPTIFKVTKFSEGTFTCENLENEFPKYIKYWKNEDNISALIYNDSTSQMSFDFVKR